MKHRLVYLLMVRLIWLDRSKFISYLTNLTKGTYDELLQVELGHWCRLLVDEIKLINEFMNMYCHVNLLTITSSDDQLSFNDWSPQSRTL